MEVIAESGDELYLKAIDLVLSAGEKSAPRGQATREVLDVTLVLNDPTLAVPLNVGRKVNLKIGAVEYLHLVGSYSSLEQLNSASNGRFSRFADEGRLRGAYGPRTAGQFAWVLDKLSTDPDSRQACVTIWRPEDADSTSRDIPCTVGFQFMIRNGALNMRTTMRSNDVWLGLPYDIFMFTRLQMSMAWALKIPVGQYTHSVGSFHIYERDVQNATALSLADQVAEQPPAITTSRLGQTASAVNRWKDVMLTARAISYPHAYRTAEKLFPQFGKAVEWYRATVPVLDETRAICSYRSNGRSGCFYDFETEPSKSGRAVRQCPECRETQKERAWLLGKDRYLKTLGVNCSYTDLLVEQGNRCKICGDEQDDRSLAIDHCHETETFRGLLCTRCNVTLGLIKDDPNLLSSMIAYLNGEL